ncbi:MAG: DUF3108 domain-containing protein [Candidatus Cloacimonetes bacterium]|nr:DUF3108 domain-containing protein [Candidatus Cloacimonadota bacterium]
MRTKFLTALLLCLSLSLSAEHLQLSISYLGLKVVNVDMLDEDSILTVNAKATGLGSIASSMDNTYQSLYSDDYLPVHYIKRISQKKYSENRITTYDRENLLASRQSFLSNTLNREYPIQAASRDFFSALYYIRFHLDHPQTLYLDANSLIWQAEYQVVDTAEINTVIGKQEAYIVEIRFSRISQSKRERSDMLTNNLVNEDNLLTLWISTSKENIPLKARYSMKPFAVYWILEAYE